MTDNTSSNLPPAGWFPDADGKMRWWDGTQWTEQLQDNGTRTEDSVPAQATFSSPAPPSSPATATTSFYEKKWFIGVAAGLVGLALGSIAASGTAVEDDPKYKAVSSQLAETKSRLATAESEVADAKTREAKVQKREDAVSEAEEANVKVEKTEKDAAEKFTMPNLVGANLQDAQDKLQKLGSYVLQQDDATGLERFQVLDLNWKVCSQKPRAGKSLPTSDLVTLAAVKLDESCP